MRIACVYHPRLYTGCGKFHFIADACRALGHEVRHVQAIGELVEADRDSDLILFEQRHPASINTVDLQTFLQSHKSFCIQWFFDLNVFDPELPVAKQCTLESSIDIARGMDLVLVKERDRLEEYQAAGINVIWFDQACPSTMRQAKIAEDPPFDVILWGSSSRPLWQQRWNDVDAICRLGFKVAWATTDGSLPNGIHRLPGCQPLEIPDLVEQAKVTLVVDACQTIDGYWSDRIWLAAGAGACILRRKSIGGDSGNLPAAHYTSEAALTELLRKRIADYQLRRHIGNDARRWVMSSETYENRIQELLNHVDRIQHQRREPAHVPEMQGV